MAHLKRSWILLALALILCGGCQRALTPGSSPVSEATTLTLEATPLGNGEFELSGTTNLPDNTKLTALALRYLAPPTPPSSLPATEQAPLYSVLDYEPIAVADGQWSTRLTLWQVAADGRYQEPWQAEAAALDLAVQPQPEVQFAITLAPDHLGTAIADALAPANRQRLAGVLRMTAAGEPFLWADRALTVGLPRGQTTPPGDLAARANGGWGDRYRLVEEPPLLYTLTPEDLRQTNALPSPGELLR
jgi:hypothetical protein